MKLVRTFLLLLIFTGFAYSQNDTVTTASGLKYIVIEKGTGAKAEANKAVEVHYTGYLLDGKVFDSSRERGEPIEFVLGAGQVIKGWDEGIALMNVGGKMKLIIPPALGYGDRAMGDVIPANSTLVFDVELMGVSEPKTSIADVLLETLLNAGADSARAQYYSLKKDSLDKYNFKESQLNTLGYQLLQVGRTDDAIAVLKLNAEVYPKSFNVYDSLAEACMVKGDKEQAKENYKKSLQINPGNKNAEEKLKTLQ